MTARLGSAIARGMFRRGLFLLCMLLTSLTAVATLHAREFPGAVSVDCSGYMHGESDPDQTPADAEKALPHHHGSCHGAVAFIPIRNSAPMSFVARTQPAFHSPAAALYRWSPCPGLRPPIA